MNFKLCAIAAMDAERVIGLNNQLPWKLPQDLKRFAALTTGHTVLMGRKTYQSLPGRFRPLPQRKNIVISRGTRQAILLPKDVELWNDPRAFLDSCRDGTTKLPSEKIWIIGGAELYAATQALWDEVYLTRIDGRHEGDAFFPAFESKFELKSKEPHEGYVFEHYARQSA
jgi:dihydrofolate reductase